MRRLLERIRRLYRRLMVPSPSPSDFVASYKTIDFSKRPPLK